ncbi:uncharacterized protein [Chelonus insularis]|uniref:uncharacterized protein n=1 Tax=Chelonus insularis TaxID=460826 RepID=UPI001588CD2C|nr:uncharacterized protein LOC118066428 [Chelonus insularis]
MSAKTPIEDSDETSSSNESQSFKILPSICETMSLESSNEPLYSQVRRKLNKVNRVSKSALPAPSTPSKSGVIVESCAGKFSEIKARFERQLLGCEGSEAKSSTKKKLTKKFSKYYALGYYTMPKRLFDLAERKISPSRYKMNNSKEADSNH